MAAEIDSGAHRARIARDIASAEASGATGTPTFFVNGKRLFGAYDAGSLVEALEADAVDAAMKALVQRVSQAAVDVEGDRVAQIGPGMLVLLGVGVGDGEEEADRLAEKVRKLRIFDDAEGRMNEPLGEREVLCVSQFTLYGDARKRQPPQLRRGRPAGGRRAALRPLLRAARGEEGRLRRLHGRGPDQRRAGDADAGGPAGCW